MREAVVTAVIGVVAVVLAWAAIRLARDTEARRDYVATVRSIRWWMWPGAFAHIVVLVSALIWLMTCVPQLRIGWWMLLGGSGNIMLGQSGRDGSLWHLIAAAIPVAVVILVPHFAIQEEYGFRYGNEDDSGWVRLGRQTRFGLGHSLFMGVPIAAGLLLVGSGLLYDSIYMRSLKRLSARTELVSVAPSPQRLDYPPTPSGPYDPQAWAAHHAEFDRISNQNRQLRDNWLDEVERQRERQSEQIDELRTKACATAAAFHCCTNWLVAGALFTWLVVS